MCIKSDNRKYAKHNYKFFSINVKTSLNAEEHDDLKSALMYMNKMIEKYIQSSEIVFVKGL